MRSTNFLCIAAAAATLLSGCATVTHGTTQKIPVTSVPTEAEILVNGKPMGTTPMTVILRRKEDHVMTIQKAGHLPQTIAIVKSEGGAVWGNVIVGGMIGWGVDAASGAQYHLLPATVSVTLASAATNVVGMTADDSTAFVEQLRELDRLHNNKSLSEEEYVNGRLKLFRRYMPEALPPVAAPDIAVQSPVSTQ
jgi:PEGA domain